MSPLPEAAQYIAGIVPQRLQGRAGLVAVRRYKGGTNALGRAFYKGGFDSKMTRREAALILQTRYERPSHASHLGPT